MRRFLYPFLFLILSNHCFGQNQSIPEDRWALVEQYLEGQKDLSGMFILGSGGEIKINHGFGFADRSKQIPFTDQSLYTIGSITKPFTATAILLLLEQSKLSPDDPISLYFDGVPEDKKGITLHQLLTHSSGLPGAIGDDYESISTLDFQKKVWEQTLLFKPGEGYEYTNVGYSLLGMIVEKLSGQSYGTFLQEKIFKPSGMITAGYTNPGADYNNLVHGYMQDGSDWGTSHDKNWDGDEPYWHLKANGGLLMSAQDMYHWYLALKEHKVLSPASLKLQTTPYVDEGGGSYYGYGYALDEDGECVQHNGGNRIFKADFRWFPKTDMFLFSATNDANVRLFRLNDEIIQLLKTGILPIQDNWELLPIETFPKDQNQYTAYAFHEMIIHYSKEKADVFIPEYCTSGLVDRNGIEKLHELFQRLNADSSTESVEAIYSSGDKIQLVIPAREENAKLKIILSFIENKIDRLMVEMVGG